MTEYGFNSLYMTKDNRPWLPVMGEFHFTRYNPQLWRESLLKIKAGGVSIVSVYVIWIHHEEEEGVFDFSGCRDIGKFLNECKALKMDVILRLGPWVHGEVRNGGFPDWLQHREGIDLRSDDPEYLKYVRRYWSVVYEQIPEMMQKDGGPVIGVQIENEYGHVGGYTGQKGEQHMKTLKALAQSIGFDVLLYTATGWGGACTGGMLPVMGGYCEAPWDQRVTELEANTNYVFSHIRNDAQIASDYEVDDSITFNQEDFPFVTAELGGGLQVTKHRRPIASGKDIGAMSLVKLGSGAALLGYYMYHGGSNPKGKFTTLQESRATGYANDLPEINYDFNAPIRQFGTISDTYREIRMLAYFLNDFGEDMAALKADIENEHIKPEDGHTLRLSSRHDDTHGYIFFNNYQRRRNMDDHKAVTLRGSCKDEDVIFPKTDIPSGDYGFFPYNMKLGKAILRSALATPLCRLALSAGEAFVFFGDREPLYSWSTKEQAPILLLSREQALKAAKVRLDQDYIVIADDFVWEDNGRLIVNGPEHTVIYTYPELKTIPEGFKFISKDGELYHYERNIEKADSRVSYTLVNENQDSAVYEIDVAYNSDKHDRTSGRDTLLEFDYACESMDIYLDGKKINDYFYTGQKALLSLGYFGFPQKLTAKLNALHEDDKIYLQTWPEMNEKRACSIHGIEVKECYEKDC